MGEPGSKQVNKQICHYFISGSVNPVTFSSCHISSSQGRERAVRWRGAILDKVIKEGLSEEVRFVQSLKEARG